MPSIVRPTVPLRPLNPFMWRIFGVRRGGSKADRHRRNFLPAVLITFGYVCGLQYARLGRRTSQVVHADVDAPLAILNVSALSHTAQMFPGSIAAVYAAIAPTCLRGIHAPRLRTAVNEWAQRRPKHVHHAAARDVTLAARPHTLTVQACGKADPHVAHVVARRARDFSTVLLVPMGRRGLSVALMLQRALRLKRHVHMRHQPLTREDTDTALWIFSRATHVVVCPGPYGALAALITHGIIYATQDSKVLLDHAGITAIMQMPVIDVSTGKSVFSAPQRAQAAVGPVASSCCNFMSFGGAVLCANARGFVQPPCWALAIGTGPTFEFERTVVRQSACNVQVFTCGPFIPDIPSDLASRISVRRSCLRAEGGGLTWLNVIEAGAKGAGLPRGVAPSFTRIDVETGGVEILRSLVSETKDPSLLPEQISVILHFDRVVQQAESFSRRSKDHPSDISAQNVAMLFSNLSHGGYDLVHRAPIRGFEHRIEITLLHRSVAPPFVLLQNRTTLNTDFFLEKLDS